MLAARWWGRKDVRLDDVAAPGAPAPGWVNLRVEACGICGTDLEEYRDGPILVPRQPHPLTHRCAPLTLGHEAVGIVDEVGEGVALAVGTRVAVETNISCGTCFWCDRGETTLCPSLACLGLMGDGGLAERLAAPALMCAPVGAHVPLDHATFAEPLSVAVRAVRKARVAPGSTVGIVGCGTVGLLLVQVARAAGARSIVAVDHLVSRRHLAMKLGADVAVSPEQAQAAGLEATGGVGLDITIEAAGNPAAAAAAIRLSRRGGRTVLLGVFDADVPVGMLDVLLGEKEIVASLSHVFVDDFLPAIEMINSGAILLDQLITARIPLSDVVDVGFTALLEQPQDHLKIVVYPNGIPSP